MNGRSPIVLAVRQHDFHEHPDIDAAEREAYRLVTRCGVVEAVVYVPKRVISAEVITEHIRGNGRPESVKGPIITPTRQPEVMETSSEIPF